MIGIAMSDDNGFDLQRVLRSRRTMAKTLGDVAGKENIVATVDKDDSPTRCFKHQAVSLLHVDHGQLQHSSLAQGRPAANETRSGTVKNCQRSHLGPLWVGDVQDLDGIAEREREKASFAGVLIAAQRHKIVIDKPGLGHLAPLRSNYLRSAASKKGCTENLFSGILTEDGSYFKLFHARE